MTESALKLQLYKFNRNIECFRKLGIPYRIVEYSSRAHLYSIKKATGEIFRRFDYVFETSQIDGIGIVHRTFNNVLSRMESGLYVPKNTDTDRTSVKTSFFNDSEVMHVQSPIRDFARDVIAVDINSCYFNTLFQLGAIDEACYRAGFKKKEAYKLARNIAVGSLNRTGLIREWDGVSEYETTGLERRNTAVVRLDVIDTVYNRCLEIARALESDFLFFLTDCFFIRPSGLEKLKTLLDSHLYTYKTENIRLVGTETNQNNTTIRWKSKSNDSASYIFNNYSQKLSNQVKYSGL
jgi:hypothetical protein